MELLFGLLCASLAFTESDSRLLVPMAYIMYYIFLVVSTLKSKKKIWSSQGSKFRTNMFDVVDDAFISKFIAMLVFNMENCIQVSFQSETLKSI